MAYKIFTVMYEHFAIICKHQNPFTYALPCVVPGQPENIIVPFEESRDFTQIIHPTLDIRLIGRPGLVPGKIGNALELRGRGQYADLGAMGHTCMGNLARCTQGITLSAWMKFRSFENDMVFLSTGQNGLLMIYRDGYVHVSADGRGESQS